VSEQDSWYHQQFNLPSGADLPTPSEWNWLVEWYESPLGLRSVLLNADWRLQQGGS
jgi:hypothetical protein